jgi:hypothetical protein
MKLEINLDDRAEIAAAVPLLQLILDGTTTPARAVPPAPAPSIAAVPTPPNAPEAAPVSSTVAFAPQPPAPPAPTAVAPSAPVAPTSLAPDVERDSKGLPWDERIHASTKSKLTSGEWKAKRNVDAALVATVEAELRAVGANATATPAQVFGGAVAPAPLPIAPPVAPLPPAAPVAPLASAEPTTFEQLMPKISAAVIAKTLPPTALQEACAANGLASIVMLQQNAAFVPMVWATLRASHPAIA